MRGISVSRFAFREHTTGADAPRSCVAVRMSAGGKTILAMHKRTFARSGGRQPAVGVETRLHRDERDCPQDLRRCVSIAVAFACSGAAKSRLLCQRQLSAAPSGCICVNSYHGGLTPPALAYRVPQTAGQRWWTPSAARFVSHGGLTPPALALPCECLPAKNGFFDAQTHTEKKERRA
jgi:hypothetical protein